MLVGSVWIIVALEIIETALYMHFKMHRTAYRKPAIVAALNTVAIFLLASYYLYLKKTSRSIREEILVRVLMCKTSTVIISSILSFIESASTVSYVVYVVLFYITYVIRVCFCEYIKQNFRRRMLGGLYNDIIWLEKFVIATRNYCRYGRKKRRVLYEQTAESFYQLGYPEPLDAEYFFRCWNDRGEILSLQESEHDNFIIEMESSNFSADHHLLSCSDEKNTNTHVRDTREDSITGFRACAYEEKSLEEQYTRGCKITVSSLQRHFYEKDALEIFRIISFDRGIELSYKIFAENVRQINNERTNLYKSIDDLYELMFRVKLGAILLQTVSCVSLLFLFLETGTFITMLCLPFFLFLLLPSLERVSSSIFFILVSNPFNSGDRIFLDGENMVVRKISLLSTRLDRWNGENVVVSNQKIAQSTIYNIMRSISQQWKLDLVVPSSTGKEKIDFLRSSLKKFTVSEKVFLAVSMNCSEIVDSKFIRISIIVKHKRNYQNGFFTWVNHNKFMKKLIVFLKELEVKYIPIEFPVHIEESRYATAWLGLLEKQSGSIAQTKK